MCFPGTTSGNTEFECNLLASDVTEDTIKLGDISFKVSEAGSFLVPLNKLVPPSNISVLLYHLGA